jgi:hypothetical protein
MEPSPSQAELAVLDMALDEALGASLPDLWPRLAAATGEPAAPAVPRRWRLAVACTIAAAAAIVVAVGVLVRRPGAPRDRVSADGGLAVDPRGPGSLAEVRARFAGERIRSATVRAEAVFAPELARWIPLRMHELEGLFESDSTTAQFGFDDRALLAAALSAAAPAVLRPGGTVWPYRIDLAGSDRVLRLLLRDVAAGGEIAPLEFAVAGPDGPIGMALDPRVHDLVRAELGDIVEATIRSRGIAIGERGLDALPDTARRLRLHGVPPAAVARLARFAKLESIDLRDVAPWHAADVLLQVSRLPLPSLVLSGADLTAEAIAVLPRFSSLRELLCLPPGPYTNPWPVRVAPSLDDRAAARIAGIANLEELGLHGCRFSSDGIALLAALPKLKQIGLDTDVEVDLHAFAALPAIRTIQVRGAMTRAGLAGARTVATLRKLTLWPQPSLGDADLVALHGAAQLERIELVNCPWITEPALEALRAALPSCRVGRDDW